MKRISVLLLLLVVAAPDAAEAQRRYRHNSFSFTPYAGGYRDAYDLEADGSNLGWLLGFKAGYQPGARTNLHLNLGYAEANDVASRPLIGDGTIYDNQWVLLTGGGDFALVPGTTSIAVGADLGIGWRRTDASRTPPGITAENDGWATYEVIAPALVLRHRFTPRTSLVLTLQDYIFSVFEDDAEHSPALTLGLSLR